MGVVIDVLGYVEQYKWAAGAGVTVAIAPWGAGLQRDHRRVLELLAGGRRSRNPGWLSRLLLGRG